MHPIEQAALAGGLSRRPAAYAEHVAGLAQEFALERFLETLYDFSKLFMTSRPSITHRNRCRLIWNMRRDFNHE
jgi:hypothetical protein